MDSQCNSISYHEYHSLRNILKHRNNYCSHTPPNGSTGIKELLVT